jgi:ABC-type Mn2+/Zn2+ transport system ATPase subunit
MSGVDALTESDIFNLLGDLRQDGTTILMATHDLSCVADRFDRALFLNRSVIAYGPPAETFTEETLRLTYGTHVVLVRIGDRYVAVEAAAHHDQPTPEAHQVGAIVRNS